MVASALAVLLTGTLCFSTGLRGRAEEALSVPGQSISRGAPQHGRLVHPAELPIVGAGYVVPPHWTLRHTNFGSYELVRAIERAAASVADGMPGALAGVADMSEQDGGPLGHHASHESGRDVDILYYSVDDAGRPLPPPDDMIPYRPDGRAAEPDADGRVRHFDDARNWAFVRSLLADQNIQVEWIFMQRDLRERLLSYAATTGADDGLLARAASALHQPTDSLPHDDHMHLRIACPASDVAHGCEDIWIRPHRRRHLARHHEHRGRRTNS